MRSTATGHPGDRNGGPREFDHEEHEEHEGHEDKTAFVIFETFVAFVVRR